MTYLKRLYHFGSVTAMRAYQKAFQTMIEQNKELFDTFKHIHDAYVLNPEANKQKFDDIGKDVVEIIREADRRLCAQMGKGMYSKFTQNLSEKFWGEVRKLFPKIDFVGVR
ncbi:MAG: hypothetical protein N3A54_01805 [Patescibacteria group bacterium]|nr:hypothetical protein [Patescibacteria group bacterium]